MKISKITKIVLLAVLSFILLAFSGVLYFIYKTSDKNPEYNTCHARCTQRYPTNNVYELKQACVYACKRSFLKSSELDNFDDNTGAPSKLISYDGEFYTLEYPSILDLSGSYLITKDWKANKEGAYQIEINTQTDAVYAPEKYIQMKMDEPGYLSFSNAKIERYKQNGFDVVKATWSDELNKKHPWSGQAEYYFYKDGKSVYLLGMGQNSSYLDQVANSIKAK